jgi:2-hydroxychromene-2-carboxylate isomerase
VSELPVRFYFDYISHNAYLAFTQLALLRARFGREFMLEPVLFAGLLNHYGQLGPAEIPPKARWMMLDVVRKARRLGVPIAKPYSHPFVPLLPLRVSFAPLDPESRLRLVDAVFRAVWAESVDASDARALEGVITAAGLDGAALVAYAQSDAAKAALRESTERAIADGVFGVPSFRVGDELFWGFDDLPHLELHLAGRDPLEPGDPARFTTYAASARRRRPGEA